MYDAGVPAGDERQSKNVIDSEGVSREFSAEYYLCVFSVAHAFI
jgi:hypothetical protein